LSRFPRFTTGYDLRDKVVVVTGWASGIGAVGSRLLHTMLREIESRSPAKPLTIPIAPE
jgi:hypothetical protein